MKPRTRNILGWIFTIWGVLFVLKMLFYSYLFFLSPAKELIQWGFLQQIIQMGEIYFYFAATANILLGIVLLIGGILLLKRKTIAISILSTFAAGKLIVGIAQIIHVILTGVIKTWTVFSWVNYLVSMIIFAIVLWVFVKK